jgi:hypothetical protein
MAIFSTTGISSANATTTTTGNLTSTPTVSDRNHHQSTAPRVPTRARVGQAQQFDKKMMITMN